MKDHHRFTRRKRHHLFSQRQAQEVQEATPRTLSLSKTLKPETNFYEYVNGSWLDKVNMPSYETSFSVSEEVENKVNSQIKQILEESAQHTFEGIAKTPQDVLSIVAQSALRPEVQKQSVATLREFLQNYHCIRDIADCTKAIAEHCLGNIPTFLEVRITIESETSNLYHLCIEPDFPGIHYKYYKPQEDSNKSVLKGYDTLCRRVGKVLGIDGLEQLIAIENDIVISYIQAKNENLKHIRGADLEKKCGGIPWDVFFEALGVSNWRTQTIYVRSFEWLRLLQTLLKTKDIQTWKLFLMKQLIFYALKFLPHPFNTFHYDFFGKQLQGQTQKTPQQELTIQILMNHCEDELSYLYVKLFVPESLKTKSQALANEIVTAAQDRLSKTEWLTPATRKKAIEKLRAVGLGIAYPDEWRPFQPVEGLSAENLLKNLLILGRHGFKQILREIGKRPKYWDEGAFRVNAYYFNETNELIIPAGSILSPFYSDTAPLGWNYGGLGAIMGHELTHAFDEEGKEYDPKGRRKAWWSASDLRHYRDVSNDLIQLFSAQTLEGHTVNGAYTLSENIADLGGLSFALDALKKELKRRGITGAEKEKEAYRWFFISFAVSWRTKIRKVKLEQMLLLDNHSPPILRVNCIVKQFPEWYAAFHIPESKEKKIQIF